jgi:hypothetical protein
MGKKDQPKSDDKGKDDYVPGTIKGELDFYDNVTKPIKDALDVKREWEEQNTARPDVIRR